MSDDHEHEPAVVHRYQPVDKAGARLVQISADIQLDFELILPADSVAVDMSDAGIAAAFRGGINTLLREHLDNPSHDGVLVHVEATANTSHAKENITLVREAL